MKDTFESDYRIVREFDSERQRRYRIDTTRLT